MNYSFTRRLVAFGKHMLDLNSKL